MDEKHPHLVRVNDAIRRKFLPIEKLRNMIAMERLKELFDFNEERDLLYTSMLAKPDTYIQAVHVLSVIQLEKLIKVVVI